MMTRELFSEKKTWSTVLSIDGQQYSSPRAYLLLTVKFWSNTCAKKSWMITALAAHHSFGLKCQIGRASNAVVVGDFNTVHSSNHNTSAMVWRVIRWIGIPAAQPKLASRLSSSFSSDEGMPPPSPASESHAPSRTEMFHPDSLTSLGVPPSSGFLVRSTDQSQPPPPQQTCHSHWCATPKQHGGDWLDFCGQHLVWSNHSSPLRTVDAQLLQLTCNGICPAGPFEIASAVLPKSDFVLRLRNGQVCTRKVEFHERCTLGGWLVCLQNRVFFSPIFLEWTHVCRKVFCDHKEIFHNLTMLSVPTKNREQIIWTLFMHKQNHILKRENIRGVL